MQIDLSAIATLAISAVIGLVIEHSSSEVAKFVTMWAVVYFLFEGIIVKDDCKCEDGRSGNTNTSGSSTKCEC